LAHVDDRVDWDTALPRVLGPLEAAGTWPAHGALVGPGTGDNMAGALALGLQSGDLVLSFGTSATAYTVAERPSADPSGAVAGFADATGRFLPLVCTLNAMKVTDTVARMLGVDLAQFDHLALAAPAGAEGLALVPYFDGERTPNRPDATGVVSGLRTDATPGLLARAAVEGVVCNLLDGADALDLPATTPDQRVFLVGGGAQSPAYRRIVADLTGRRVIVPVERELVACGAALQAAAVLHQCAFADLAEAWGLGRGELIEPDDGVDRAAIRARYTSVAQSVDS
jgi:xylulokinase